jgi:hypothetical protein
VGARAHLLHAGHALDVARELRVRAHVVVAHDAVVAEVLLEGLRHLRRERAIEGAGAPRGEERAEHGHVRVHGGRRGGGGGGDVGGSLGHFDGRGGGSCPRREGRGRSERREWGVSEGVMEGGEGEKRET